MNKATKKGHGGIRDLHAEHSAKTIDYVKYTTIKSFCNHLIDETEKIEVMKVFYKVNYFELTEEDKTLLLSEIKGGDKHEQIIYR